MKIVNTLETIREGVALGAETTLPPSYAATPHRIAGTPVVSPYGHHRYRHGQSLINGLRSPPEMATSRTSHISIQSGHESDVTSQIHVRSCFIIQSSAWQLRGIVAYVHLSLWPTTHTRCAEA